MYHVYVLRSKTTGKIYIGYTRNLEKRLIRHNDAPKAKKMSYTRLNKGPWELVYKEELTTRKEATNREKYLKSHKGRDWVKSIVGA